MPIYLMFILVKNIFMSPKHPIQVNTYRCNIFILID